MPIVLSASALLAAQTAESIVQDPVEFTQDICDAVNIPTDRKDQPYVGFAHNDSIGIEPSTYLPGLLDLKYHDPETQVWETYNVIVPNVVANNSDVNAEIYGATVTMEHNETPDGGVVFAINYEPFDEIKCIDGIVETPNGAHFQVVGSIHESNPEISMQIVPHDGSAEIESASLGNFFGAAEMVDQFQVEGQQTHFAEEYPQPNDGTFMLGDFYSLPLPENGIINFGSMESNMHQWQRFTDGERLEYEIRAHNWRPEFSGQTYPNWFEVHRVWQDFTEANSSNREDLPTWTFGYNLEGDIWNPTDPSRT
jgi:hypothetical protein